MKKTVKPFRYGVGATKPSPDPIATKAPPKRVPVIAPPASEGEMPDAAPIAPPVQSSSTPKMVSGNAKTGLSMRKPIKD